MDINSINSMKVLLSKENLSSQEEKALAGITNDIFSSLPYENISPKEPREFSATTLFSWITPKYNASIEFFIGAMRDLATLRFI
jgi:hypothetical protein